MSPSVVMLVLTAALLHASWNAMVKSGGYPEFSIASYQLVGSLVCLGLIWFVPLPPKETWPFIIASTVIHNIYYLTLARCYRSGDLSLVYPLFRGLAPVLVVIGAALFAAERLPVSALLGVCLVSFGLIGLALFGSHKARPSPEALSWGLLTSLLIAVYTVVDGLGVRTVPNSLSYILWLFLLEPIPICTWLLLTNKSQWFSYIASRPGKVIAGGVASSAAYGLVIYAMTLGAMALVSSLRETSVIFAALIGTVLLREPFGRQRIVAAIVVATGVIVIRYFGAAI
jgi:drug/metabolite transporter (DMT)-like permease